MPKHKKRRCLKWQKTLLQEQIVVQVRDRLMVRALQASRQVADVAIIHQRNKSCELGTVILFESLYYILMNLK